MDESSDSSTRMAPKDDESFLEAAAGYIRRGSTSNPKHAQKSSGETVGQIRLFHEWAHEEGRLISASYFLHFSLVSERTSEHKVYFDPLHNRAVKQTWPGQFGWVPKLENGRWSLGIAEPLDYLERWILFNKVFGDEVRLEGVFLAGQSMLIGDKTETISAIISQGWHHAADIQHPAPSEKELSLFLIKLGFESVENSFHGWQRAADSVVILDARPDNFIKTEKGIAPIDLPMLRA